MFKFRTIDLHVHYMYVYGTVIQVCNSTPGANICPSVHTCQLVRMSFYISPSPPFYSHSQDEDKGHFKDDMMKDARLLRRCLSTGNSISSESECSTARGIEHFASNTKLHQLSDAKTKVIRSVLIEQHCQRTRYGHVTDPLQIAVASSEHSLGAKKTAIGNALLDQEFVISTCHHHGDDGADQLHYKHPQDGRVHNSQAMMLLQNRASSSMIPQRQETPTSSSSSSIARW